MMTEKPDDFPQKQYTKWFDYDKIRNTLSIRSRKTGDFIRLGNGRKKLKDFFIDEKILKQERDKVPLLSDGNEILWVVGYRMSDHYKVSADTKRILEVVITKEEQ